MDDRWDFPLIADVFRPVQVDRNVVRFGAPHLGGAGVPTRLFGGQTLSAIQLSVQILHPKCHVLSIRSNFVAPGLTNVLVKCVVDQVPQTPFLNVSVCQKNRIIATARVKIGLKDDLLSIVFIQVPIVKSPFTYPSVAHHINNLDDSTNHKFLRKLVKWDLFEMRPTDLSQFFMKSKEIGPLIVWCRLAQSQRNIEFPKNSGNAVLAMLTDYWTMNSPVENFERYFKENPNFPASLNHNITFYDSENVDPVGWFLVETECNVHASNHFLMKGHIFDESRKCLVSFEQEGYMAG
ncbi:hypothetical protein QR680_018077 [Steinernema hermaphroditum]|uniref:Acyl-CoA thioesterase-like C-terminal domain-containing protein n=1 Tax=Steinernema hermaphroditum TaxID=289476 RepID=A0AA39HJ72_9BILA|nr:hypothetical protein QR680_018077 [Steinernema hermaphroditum]